MNGSVLAVIVPFLLCFAQLIYPIEGGICWTTINKNGRCTEILSQKLTKEECCSVFVNVNTAWSNEDMDAGNLFFQRVLGGGVPCHPCRVNCTGVQCPPGKRCVMRSGRPKCVCAPCKEKDKNSLGPVCGNDGNTYMSYCQLKKQACRRRNSNLKVAYTGFCQSTCETIKCPGGKFCLLDQNLVPHCVRCMIRCKSTMENSKPVCGSDGVTYNNICDLRQMVCKKGISIPMAYKGKCIDQPNCGLVRCKEDQLCVTDLLSNRPRCITCSDKCEYEGSKQLGGPICGSNNKTYPSWCHMIKDACDKGFVINTLSRGPCPKDRKPGVIGTFPVAIITGGNETDLKVLDKYDGKIRKTYI